MNEELRLSESERALLIELLEGELQELPVEIHHSRTINVREGLRHRRTMVRELLDRLHVAAIV